MVNGKATAKPMPPAMIGASGDRIASVAADNELMMWVVMAQSDTFSLSDSRRLFGHRRKIDRVVYNRSGSRIASAAGAEIRVWNTDTRNAIPTFGSPSFTSLVHFTHHGDRIFGVDLARKRTSLWSYPDINLISESGFSADAYANHFTADGLHIAMSFLDGQCRLWDSRTGELQFEYQCPEPAVFLTCSGSRLCIGNDAEATVWDWKSKELRGTIRNPQFGKFRASPDGRVLLAQYQDSAEGTMARFELDGDLSMPQEIEKSETCNPGYFSKSGRYFWCHGIQQPGYAIPISSYIRIIDTQSGAVILNTHEGDSLVRNVFIDDTDTRLFIDYVQHPRHTAEIYSLPDGALIDSIGPPEGEVTAWTNDMSFVAFRSVDGSTLLWNSVGDKLVGKLEIGGSQCRSVCFSEDNKYVAVEHFSESTGADAGTNRVSLWSTQPLNLITIVPGKNKCAFQTAFLRDGENFWTLSAENQIRVWPLDVVACAKKHVSRTLTVDEQRMYGVDRIRQVPDAAPRQRPERTLKWDHLSDRIRLLSPVTAERRRSAVALIADVKRWLHEKATQEEVSQALEAVELLRSGPFDTDPLVLAGIAELHAEFGDPHTAVQLLELAARHPRAVDLDGALAEARNKIAPRLVSLRSADAVAEAAFAETATSDDNRAYENARKWVAEHSPPMAHYLAARRLRLEGKAELAQPILRQLADTALTSSGPETGPEVFLQLAECHMELGQPEAAVSVLRSALEEERLCPPEIWNRWLQISFANLGLSPQQLMTQLPMKTNSIAPELRYEESVS